MIKLFYSVFLFLAPSLSFAGTLQDFAADLAKDSKIKSLKIAVMDINTTETGSRQDAIVVRERIATFLLQNNVGLVERDLLEKVLQEQRLQATGAVRQDTAKQIGELTGADAILSGTLAEITDTKIELNARVVDAKTGEIVYAGQAVFKKDWKAPPTIPATGASVSKDDARTYFNQGIQYYSEGKYSVSIEFLSKAIKSNPVYLEAYYYRGSISLLKGSFEAAVSDFSAALNIKPDFFEGYYNRGVAYSNMSDHGKAIQDYNKAIELRPEFSDAYHNRAVAFDNLKQYKAALADYSKAIELDPKSAMSYYYRARIYDSLLLGKFEEAKALRDYDSFLNLNPNDADGHFYRGLLYSVSGEKERAIQDYKKVLEISPDYDMAHYNLGGLYYESGRYAAAVLHLKKAAQLTGFTFSLLHQIGDTYYRMGNLEESAKTYKELISKFPSDYYGYTKSGVLYLLRKDYSNSVKNLELAIGLWTEKGGHIIPFGSDLPCYRNSTARNAEALYALSLAQTGPLKKDESTGNSQKAVELDPSMRGLTLKELAARVFDFEAYCKKNLKRFQELDVNLNKPWRPSGAK